MVEIILAPVTDFDRLGQLWTEFERDARGSFFQSWMWTGCLIDERFPHPYLLQAVERGRTIAMAFLNERRGPFGTGTLLLGESGSIDHDAMFVEHNGLLMDRNAAISILGECLRAAQAQGGKSRVLRRRSLVLSGVPAEYLAAAREISGAVSVRRVRRAPYVDLSRLRQTGAGILDSVSANARYQLRRSVRRYAAIGPLAIRRAETLDEAEDFLTRLIGLHQRTWTRRGAPGAFANPVFKRFHQALLRRAFAGGHADLLEIAAGQKIIGFLYNFIYRGHVYAYQSGFDYGIPHPHCKPGSTCHHLAIDMYCARGMEVYDFLAGEDRYKMSLANSTTSLYWIVIHPSLLSRAMWLTREKLLSVVASRPGLTKRGPVIPAAV